MVTASMSEYDNRPLKYLKKHAGKSYHPGARGKRLFYAEITSPDFQKLMRLLGQKGVGRPSSKPIEIVIMNDAQDAYSGTYYAKFVEYGYTWVGHWVQEGGKWWKGRREYIPGDGEWKPGLRLYSRLRKWIKRELVRNYKAMAHDGRHGYFTRDTVVDAMSKTAENTVEKLKDMSEHPIDTGRMKEHWSWYVKGSE